MSGFRKISTKMIDPRLPEAVGGFLLSRLRPDHPVIFGIAGSQGSGKSTLAAHLAKTYGGVSLSLDDAYLMREERVELARRVHPLFHTRGVPGTHDLELLGRVLDALLDASENSETPLPAFDKLADERLPIDQWPVFKGRPRFVILEGWCLGVLSEPEARLADPVNTLEAEADVLLHWREAVNQALSTAYAALHQRLEALVYLRAPDFDTVLDWRCEQEAGLLGVEYIPAGRRGALARFVAHFQRLTLWMMQGGIRADMTVDLDTRRRVVAIAMNHTT